jgi:sugar O-acyltransferase (sialic acid O-acetyltransferase NeuD family)
MKKIILYGASKYGGEVADHIHDINKASTSPEWEIVGFIDDSAEMQGKSRDGIPVLGNKEWFKGKDVTQYFFLCCIGKPSVKRKVIEFLDTQKVKYATILHPSVIKSTTATIGEGCIVMAGNILSTHVIVDSHTILNMGCMLGHDVHIQKYCCINPVSSINGGTVVGEGVLVGTHATILEGLTIGKDSIISAAAMVHTDVPEKVVIMGVPGRVIDRL